MNIQSLRNYFAVTLLLAAQAFSQGLTGQISGTVADPSGSLDARRMVLALKFYF